MSQLPPTATETESFRERRRMRRVRRAAGLPSGSISGGVLLIGLGMLVITDWWWPGIMLVIGLASASELARRGQIWAALTTFFGFAAIPVAIALVQAINIPWLPVGAFVLIALGVLAVARNLASDVAE